MSSLIMASEYRNYRYLKLLEFLDVSLEADHFTCAVLLPELGT